MNNDKDLNQTNNMGCPLACAFLLVVFMAAIWFMIVAVEGSGPFRVRRDALLPMLGWGTLAGFGIAAFVFILRTALDKAVKLHDNDMH